MPRTRRVCTDGVVCHVLNRAVGRATIFSTADDYSAFERVLDAAVAAFPIRLLTYCLMPNHWHMVVWPETVGQLSKFMHWLTMTHTMRWHHAHQSVGTGPLYQGRFKSFPVEADNHFLTVCRYVDRNPLRANLVRRAEDWRWSGLWQRMNRGHSCNLSAWPVVPPSMWLDFVNEPQTEAELAELRRALRQGVPYKGTGALSAAERAPVPVV